MTLRVPPAALATEGYYLFPCSDGESFTSSKTGGLLPAKTPLLPWRTKSTTDIETIRAWEVKYPNAWWGIDCGKSGLLVLDDDRGKHPEAENSLTLLELEHGALPPTLTVQTVSGGYHYYYIGEGPNTASKLGPGLDTRGVGGFVVAPCSPGYRVTVPREKAKCPDWLIELLGHPHKGSSAAEVKKRKQKQEPAEGVELDSPGAVERAGVWLRDEAPLAYEGDAGDRTTFSVACRLRDMGLSAGACVREMLIHWNDRCKPPWSLVDLQQKVANAFAYARNDKVGEAAPEAAFDKVVVDVTAVEKGEKDEKGTESTGNDEGAGDDESTGDDESKPSLFVEANALIERDIQVEYLVEGLLETPSTGLIFGDPSAGKSFLAIDMACAVACGMEWMGNPSRQGIAVYFAGEGRHGVRRRIKAWTLEHDVHIPQGHLWISESRIEFSAKGLKPVVEELRRAEETIGKRVELCVVDTLARHIPSSMDENSAKDTGSFVNACDWLRDQMGGVVAVVHHSGKLDKRSSRGSSAIRGAMDWEFRVAYTNHQRSVEFTKQKESEIPPPFGFRLQQVAIDEEGTTSAVPLQVEYDRTRGHAASLGADAGLALSILQFEAGDGFLLEKEWRIKFIEALDTGNLKPGTLRQKFSRAKTKLLHNSLVRYEGDRVYAGVNEEGTPSE